MIAEQLHALSSQLLLGSLDTSQTVDYGSLFQQYVKQFTSDVSQLLLTIDSTVVTISSVAFVTLLLLGIFLYFTHLHRRLGKDLIYGGVVLGILVEFVFPLFIKS